MRLLHTSDWHLGRTLHGLNLIAEQRQALDHIVDIARDRQVDAVLVSGDVYDRGVPPVEAVELFHDALRRLAEFTTVIVTSGNHDSAIRLGYGADLFTDSVHVRTRVTAERIGTPVELTDEHGPVLVFGLPWLDPDVARHRLSEDEPLPRTHEAVMSAALDLVRTAIEKHEANLGAPVRSVVLAHAFVGHIGTASSSRTDEPSVSESERDIAVGGVAIVPSRVFDGITYSALGHLHGPQQPRLDGTGTVRYSGSPLRYSFSEAGHTKSVTIVDLGHDGQSGIELVEIPQPRPMAQIQGPLDVLLTSDDYTAHEDVWVKAVVTDAVRPEAHGRPAPPPLPAPAHHPAPAGGPAHRPRRRRPRRRRRPVAGNHPVHSGRHRAGRDRRRDRDRSHRLRTGATRGGERLMQLHRLTFAGLGPFKDEQTIDFAHLAESPLFLLEGPTGSGKSTIIDALVFALYGGVATTDGDDARLVSHYLEAGVCPFVDLVFETTAGVFRVRRTPKFERPKKVGTGTRSMDATAKLWRLTSPDAETEGEPLATSPRDVGPEIEVAVGLTRRQFIGTVILPQGEFAAFLKAHVNERQAILQRIFRTEQYETLQKRLRGMKNDAERTLKDADHAVDVAAAHFVQAAGLDSSWQTPADPEERIVATDTVLTALKTTETTCLAAQRGLEADERRARAALDHLTRRQERRDRKAAALVRAQRLDADADAQAEREAQLDADARATRVTGALTGATAAGERLGTARADEQRRRESAPADARDLSVPDLEKAVAAALAEAALLGPVVAMEAGLSTRASSIVADRARLVKLAAQLDEIEKALAALPARMVSLEAEREAARAVAAGLEAARQHVRALAQQLDAARELREAVTEQAEHQKRLAQAVSDAAAASALRDRLQRAHYAGMAAESASELSENDPCPVCGSVEHPTPAARGIDHVSKAEVDAAEARHSTADEAADDALAAKHVVDTRVETLRAKAGDAGVETLESDRVDADAAVRDAETATATVTTLTERLGELAEQHETHLTAKADLEVQQATLTARLDAEQARLDEDERVVTEARGTHVSVEARRQALDESQAAMARLIKALRATQAALDADRQRRAELDAALALEGFADTAAATTALLTPADRTRVSAAVRAYRDEEAAVRGVLSEPELRRRGCSGADRHRRSPAGAGLRHDAADRRHRAGRGGADDTREGVGARHRPARRGSAQGRPGQDECPDHPARQDRSGPAVAAVDVAGQLRAAAEVPRRRRRGQRPPAADVRRCPPARGARRCCRRQAARRARAAGRRPPGG